MGRSVPKVPPRKVSDQGKEGFWAHSERRRRDVCPSSETAAKRSCQKPWVPREQNGSVQKKGSANRVAVERLV